MAESSGHGAISPSCYTQDGTPQSNGWWVDPSPVLRVPLDQALPSFVWAMGAGTTVLRVLGETG